MTSPAFKALVFLFGIFSLCQAENCVCANFLIGEGGLSDENLIVSTSFELEDVLCDGDGVGKCKDFCGSLFSEMSEKGDLCVEVPGEDETVGQWICNNLQKDVQNVRAGVFSKSCGSNYVDTDFRYKKGVSCKDGDSDVEC